MRRGKNFVKWASYTALFAAFSAIISVAESIFVPMPAALPGVKLGLCNIAVTGALYILDEKSALCTLLIRTLISLLFGANPVSFAMSLCGGLLSFVSLLLTRGLYNRGRISFVGVSAVSAVFHSAGQTLAGACLLSGSAFFASFPLFAAASCAAGDISGAVMNIVIPRLKRSFDGFSGTEG